MSLEIQSQRIMKLLQKLNFFWTALDWLYPPECCSCHKPGSTYCDDCISQIKRITTNYCVACGLPLDPRSKQKLCTKCISDPPAYAPMRSYAIFDGTIRTAIHSLKYQQNIAVGHILADLLTEQIKTYGWSIDLLVPIPLSKSHLKNRGYNQAALIARPLARNLNILYSNHSVKRVRETKTQISLNINERFMNVNDAFYGNPATLNERRILLIDDVITTGATMQSCAKAMLNAGAKSVYCFSVARAPLEIPNKV